MMRRTSERDEIIPLAALVASIAPHFLRPHVVHILRYFHRLSLSTRSATLADVRQHRPPPPLAFSTFGGDTALCPGFGGNAYC